MRRFLCLAALSALLTGCVSLGTPQELPEGAWLTVYRDGGGQVPIVTTISVYKDGRIAWAADRETVHESRISPLEKRRIAAALSEPELQRGLSDEMRSSYAPGCCHLGAVQVTGAVNLEVGCEQASVPGSVVELITVLSEVAASHFSLVRLTCEDW